MLLEIPRPVDLSLHPLMTGNYGIATPAIEEFYELVARCLRYRVMGALIYGPSPIGKIRAIEYVRLLMARNLPRMWAGPNEVSRNCLRGVDDRRYRTCVGMLHA